MSDQDRRIWEAVHSHLRAEHPTLCRHWFDEIEPLGMRAGAFAIRAGSSIRRDYLVRSCLDALNDALRTVTGQLTAMRVLAPEDRWEGENAPRQSPRSAAPAPEAADAPIRRPAAHIASERDRLGGPDELPINADYCFENFVQGPNNMLAHSAALSVANHPGQNCNPLFIHGMVGLGKTHLLQAICLSLLEKHPGMRVLYVSCDGFVTRFMSAVQSGRMVEFRHAFRDVDLLVIDDIHFLSSRDRTQEEFFHTFNSLYQARKQIVLSSDAAPDEIPDLEARLVSRFNWGLVCKVDKPGFETRVEILKRKARMRGQELPDEVASEIARHFDSNIRELEGAVTKLQIVASLEKKPVTVELARSALADLMPRARHQAPTIDQIINEVVDYYKIKRTDILGKRKLRSVALPRQVGMYLARETTNSSYEEIGAHFGGRDHTTVMHAVSKIQKLRGETGDIDQALGYLAGRLSVKI